MHTGDGGRSVLRAYTDKGRTYQFNREEQMMQKPTDGKEFFFGTFGRGETTKPVQFEENPRVVELREEIEELKFQAFRRREWHDDPVGAEELEELAKKKAQELEALQSA
jgi:hypothetical protein